MKSEYCQLHGKMWQQGLREEDAARHLGLSRASVSQRFAGRTAWRLNEIYALLDLLDISPEEMHLYFPRTAPEKKSRALSRKQHK